MSVTSDSTEQVKTNVINVTALAPNVLVLKKINVPCALMSATLLRKVPMDVVSVLEITHAQSVFTTIKVTASHAHLIVQNVCPKMFVNHVSLVSNSTKCNTTVINILTVSKSAVMVRDSNSTAMTVTEKMVTVATVTVKSKKDGTVKVDLVLKLQLVFPTALQDPSSH